MLSIGSGSVHVERARGGARALRDERTLTARQVLSKASCLPFEALAAGLAAALAEALDRCRAACVLGVLCLLGASGAAQGLRVTPGAGADFQANGGFVQPSAVAYTLQNDESSSLQWVATSSKPWLRLDASSGSIAAGGQVTLSLSIDASLTSSLGNGTHTASVSLFDLTFASSASRTVTLQVGAGGAQLSVFPTTAWSTSGPPGGPFAPATRRYAFANVGSGTMGWTATTTASWLRVSRPSGNAASGVLEMLDIWVDEGRTATLASGTYTALLTLANTTNGVGTTNLSITLELGATPPTLSVSPATGLSSIGPFGGPMTPASMTYTLTNDGDAPLVWDTARTQSWLLFSQVAGSLAPGASTQVVASINPFVANVLAEGAYAGAITFRNATNGVGTQSRVAQLTITPPQASMQVLPATGFTASGPAGGRMVPDQQAYTIANTSNVPLAWRVTSDASWLMSTATQGNLAPGAQASILAMIDQQEAALLLPGSYSATLSIDNLSGGGGSTQRNVQLLITNTGRTLSITPTTDFTATGEPGGPIAPLSRTYTLRNLSSAPLDWAAAVLEPWLGLSSPGGTIPPNGQASLSVGIDAAATAGLPVGIHDGLVGFVNLTNGGAPQVRRVRLNLVSPGASTRSAITQFGVTWTFDRAYPAGQFANGDWWVEGPVTIVDIDPPSSANGGRVVNGSMVNPNPRLQAQGYDSAMYAQYVFPGSYDDELNVGLGVGPQSPLVLGPHSSLVSTISRSQAGLRPQLHAAAILTVLDGPAPPGSFRPPYCGKDKSIEFSEAQLDYGKLASLAPVSSTPSLAVVEQWFERPWLDHIPDWVGRYAHPLENMPDYGREICDRIGTASLMLHLDFTDAQKRTLLVRLVQLGIDFYGIVEAGGRNNWPAGGGHHSGRKWPILFAGILLGDVPMGSIGFDDNVAFNEDDQTFYVEETSTGVYNYGFGGYGPQHVGLPEWGNQHAKNYGQDSVEWYGNPYRICCTAHVWWGQLLSAYIMGARPLWNHDALFDYQDRYLQTARSLGQASWSIGWTKFPLDMWDAYRGNY